MKLDRRYNCARWSGRNGVRLAVLNRDMWRCMVVANCPRPATVADHIDPVYPGMPDHEFYAMSNLRAACHFHNTRRGVAARLERELAEGVAPEPTPNPLVARGSFLGGRAARDRRLFRSLSPKPQKATGTR